MANNDSLTVDAKVENRHARSRLITDQLDLIDDDLRSRIRPASGQR